MAFKGNLTAIATAELNLWQAGGWTECVSGTNPGPGSARVNVYWEQGLGLGYTGCDQDEYWSAAFICYCLKKAGMPASEFPFSEGHSTYIKWAIANTKQNKAEKTYYGKRLDYPPKPGDMIARWYKNSPNDPDPNITFDNQPAGLYPSHCDIVVSASATTIATIGGNVSNKVSRTVYSATDGVLNPVKELICVLACAKQ